MVISHGNGIMNSAACQLQLKASQPFCYVAIPTWNNKLWLMSVPLKFLIQLLIYWLLQLLSNMLIIDAVFFDLQVNDMESGTAAVHNETDNMAGFTEHVGVTSSAGISVVMGEYTDFPPESSEQVGALNCASVVSGEYFDTPPASMEHVGVPNGADISVVTGEYVDTPPASMEHVGATNDTTLSVITGKYMGISPVSTEHDGATSNADISVSMGEYMEMPLVTTGHSGASNNNSVSVITGEYVQIPIGSTEHFGATNSPIVTGEYVVIPPDNMPPNFMVVSKV